MRQGLAESVAAGLEIYRLYKLVDGELSAAAASAVTTVLSANESLRRKVEEYRDINRRLREFYPEKQADPVPARLLLAVSGGGGARWLDVLRPRYYGFCSAA